MYSFTTCETIFAVTFAISMVFVLWSMKQITRANSR